MNIVDRVDVSLSLLLWLDRKLHSWNHLLLTLHSHYWANQLRLNRSLWSHLLNLNKRVRLRILWIRLFTLHLLWQQLHRLDVFGNLVN